MSNWSTKKLGDICESNEGNIRTGPFGTELHKSDYQEEGIPVVNPQDLVDGNVDTSSVARVGEDHVERLSQHKLKEGDILYARRGDIGRRAYITKREAGWLCGTGCLKIDTGNNELDSKFLFYYLGDEKVTEWIYNQAVGATMANLNTSILSDVTVRYPSIDRQKEIASILSAFDDLIENNSRRIEILEEMARRIYREWFVHFRYPDHEDDELVDSGTDLGEIPEGWSTVELGEVLDINKGKNITKKTTNPGDVPVVAGGLTPAYTHDTPNTKHPVITVSASGANAGYVNLYEVDVWASDCSYVDLNATSNLYYYYSLMKENQDKIFHMQHGSAQPHVYPKDLNRLLVVEPVIGLKEKFEAFVKPIFRQRKTLMSQNKKLKETRDLLLPKLISGEINLITKTFNYES